MSAKLNLAPEVYQSGQRARRKKQLATTIGVLIGITSAVVILVSLLVLGGQSVFINSLNGQIKAEQKEIAAFSELKQATTVAQHLNSLNELMDNKVRVSRFFDVLQTVAPRDISVSSVTVDEENTLEVSASARSYALADKFAKALQASGKEIGPNASPSNEPHFQDVELSSVSSSSDTTVSFKLSTKMAPEVTNGR